MIKLESIKINPSNPRYISKEKIEKLKNSIQDFEKMMSLRPIIIDENNMILGGNMRFRALQELGYKEIPAEWVKQATDLTAEEKQEFIIKDNVGFGAWDWDILASEWDTNSLQEWGMDISIPSFDENSFTPNYSPNASYDEVSEEDLEHAKGEVDSISAPTRKTIDIICPHCAHEFEINKTNLLND